MKLIARDISDEIQPYLHSADVVVLHGARQVGKTSLLKMIASKLEEAGHGTHYMDLEDLRLLEVMNGGPDSLLSHLSELGQLGEQRLYLLVDEIQYLDDPSRTLKLLRDHHSDRIKLIVSGSSSFEIKSKFSDSLAGRTVNFEILPLSFSEFLVFRGEQIRIDQTVTSPPLIEKLGRLYREYVIFGGYPRVALESSIETRERYLTQVISTYIRKDIRDLAKIRDLGKFNKMLEALAGQCGQLLNVNELSNTCGISRQTLDNYIFILEQTYIIQLVRPFHRNIRSELSKTPKVFFHDTGIAHLLWLKSFPKTIQGNMFENSVFSELRKNIRIKTVHHWRTNIGHEIDFVISGGREVLPIEVKTSAAKARGSVFSYFQKHYSPPASYCITLNKGNTKSSDFETRFPWDPISLPEHSST